MKLYNFKSGDYDNIDAQGMQDDWAPVYIPQEPEAQNLYQLLRYIGVPIGPAMVRVLEVSIGFPTLMPSVPTLSRNEHNG